MLEPFWMNAFPSYFPLQLIPFFPRKKKGKGSAAPEKSDDAQLAAAGQSNPMKNLNDLRKAMELLSATQGREQLHQGPAKTQDEAKRKKYQFWETQPVLKIGKIEHLLLQGICLHIKFCAMARDLSLQLCTFFCYFNKYCA